MKRKTFYHISLTFPYIALIFAGALTYLTSGFDILASPGPPGILLGIIYFFLFSGIIWGPLYTWMVIVCLLWSRGRDADQVRQLYLLSPVLLACSMGIPVMLLAIPNSAQFLLWGVLRMNNLDYVFPYLFKDIDQEISMGIGAAWLFMALICVVIGYAFVGIALLIEKSLKKRNIFKEEDLAIPG